jgi:hypothetical protein
VRNHSPYGDENWLASWFQIGRHDRRLDLIRIGGRVDCVDLLSSSFVVESLQALGGGRISIRCVVVDAGRAPRRDLGCGGGSFKCRRTDLPER